METVPITHQQNFIRPGKPNRPTLFMPLEAERLPENETFLSGSTTTNSSIGIAEVNTRSDTVQPRPIFQKMPELDKNAKKINGRVVLLLKVGTKGDIQDLVVSQNSTQRDEAEQAAIRAARQSRYRPGTIGGKPSEMWMRLEYGFGHK